MNPTVDWALVNKTIPQEQRTTTMVRIAVATVESVCRIPSLAKIAVRPAKKAEPSAKTIHIYRSCLLKDLMDQSAGLDLC